jgi:hypothetical protein
MTGLLRRLRRPTVHGGASGLASARRRASSPDTPEPLSAAGLRGAGGGR